MVIEGHNEMGERHTCYRGVAGAADVSEASVKRTLELETRDATREIWIMGQRESAK